MGSGGPASRSLECDGGASPDDLAARKPRRVAGRMPVVGRVAVAVEHHKKVSIANAARVQVHDPGVCRDDVGSVGPRDVETRVDLVRPRTAGVWHLEIERRAAEALANAAWSAPRLWPLEDAGPSTGFRRRGLVLERELCDLGVDRRALRLDRRILSREL